MSQIASFPYRRAVTKRYPASVRNSRMVAHVLSPTPALFCLMIRLLIPSCLMAHDPHDPIATVAVSPDYANDQTVFMATDHLSLKIGVVALLKSTDGGLNWSAVANLPKNSVIHAIVFSPAFNTDQTIYIAGPGGLFRTSDRGVSWITSAKQSLQCVALSPNFALDNTLFVVTSQRTVLKSTDRGKTWLLLAAPPSLMSDLNSIAVSPSYAVDKTLLLGTTADGIFKSDSDGASWQWVSSGLTLPAVTSLAFSPAFSSDHMAFAASFGAGVLVSATGGDAWTPSNSGITDLNVTSLVLSPNYTLDSALWITTAANGVSRSTTSGMAWDPATTVSRTLSHLACTHYQALAAAPGIGVPVLYLAMYEGLWTSSNGGSSWQYIDTIPTRLTRYIHLSPQFAQDQTVFASTYGSGNLWSSTGGSSWTIQNTGMQHSYTDASGISPGFATDGIAFSSNDDGLQRTNDRGATWQLMLGLGVPTYPRALAVSPAFVQDSTVLIGLGGGGGHGPCSVPTVERNSPRESKSGVYRSGDGGATWLPTSLSGVTGIFSIAMSPAFNSDQTAFAASQTTGLYRSIDGGVSWASVTALPTTQVAVVAISPSFATDRTVFAGAVVGGIYKSVDRGSTWSPLSQSSSLRALSLEVSPNYASDRSIFAGTIQKGLVKFSNGEQPCVRYARFRTTLSRPSAFRPISPWITHCSRPAIMGFSSLAMAETHGLTPRLPPEWRKPKTLAVHWRSRPALLIRDFGLTFFRLRWLARTATCKAMRLRPRLFSTLRGRQSIGWGRVDRNWDLP